MKRFVVAVALALVASATVAAHADCSSAAAHAMDSTLAATTTLALATKYVTSHDDWCDGNAMSLQQQDGAAVDKAWSDAIAAQNACMTDDKVQLQMTKLIISLHNRRLKISAQIDALNQRCN